MKKLISLILAIAMVLTLFASMPMTASAALAQPEKPIGVTGTLYGRKVLDYTLATDTEDKISGERALYENIPQEDTVSPGTQLAVKMLFNKPMVSGNTYKISFWAKVTNPSNGCGVRLYNSSDSYKEIQGSLSGVEGSSVNASYGWNWRNGGQWTQYELEFTADNNYNSLAFFTWTGYVRADDISVKPLSGGVLGDEMVINGGFEDLQVSTAISDCQYPSHWYGKFATSSELLANGTRISSTNELAYSGKRSLKMSLGATSTNGDTYSILTDLGETLDASKTYTFEFYAYGSRIGGSPIKQNTSSIGWNHIWSNTTRTDMGNGWTKYEYTFTGQAATAIGIQEWESRDYYIDDVRLYETETGREITIVNGDFEDYLDFYEAPAEITYNDNWGYWLRDTGGVLDDFVRYEDIGGGNYAMHIRYNNDAAANVYIQMNNQYSNGQLVNGASYTVEYDIKGSARDYEALVFFPLRVWNYTNSFNFANAEAPGATATVTELPNGFKHVVKTFTSATSGDAIFALLVQSQCDMILDNIKVYPTGDSSVNYIVDGDFSGTRSNNTTDFENVVAYPVRAGEGITVSWTNAAGTIEDIALTLDGDAQTIDADSSSKAYNSVYIGNLTAGKTYTAVLSATINGTQKSYTRNVTVRAAGDPDSRIEGYGADYWNAFIMEHDDYYANTNITRVTDTYAEGSASVLINGNIPTKPGNVYAGIEQGVELERSSLYRLSFKAKASGIVNDFNLIESTTVGEQFFWVVNPFTLSDEWQEYSVILNATRNGTSLYDPMEDETYAARLLFMSEQFKGKIWIDDISVVEIDETTEEAIGDNVILDGSFESRGMYLGDPVLTKNGTVVSALSAGEINVNVTARDAGELMLIIAVYKNGLLYDVATMSKNVVGTEIYDTDIIIPDEEGTFTAKVMYWNNFNAITPLRAAFPIN